MIALAVLATICAKRAIVAIKPGWLEPLNLYCVIGLPPGSRKSAVVAECIRPLVTFVRTACQKLGTEISKQRAVKNVLEQAARTAAKQAAANPDSEELLVEAGKRAAAADMHTVPTAPRLLCDDATPEKLARLIATHGGRMAIISAEGGPFEMMAGRYTDLGSLEIYLKAHIGDSILVDRVSGDSIHIPAPALTLGLAVQTDVIHGLAQHKGFRGRGLLGRLLFALPANLVGQRRTRVREVEPATAGAYSDHMVRLLELRELADWGTEAEPVTLELEPSAREAVLDYADKLEPRLGPAGDLGAISDWGAKLVGALVRIAGLLHVAETMSFSGTISRETMLRALQLGDYFTEHAVVAFGLMGADPAIHEAQQILEWLRYKKLVSFTKRDVFEGLKARFKRARELDEPLALLVEHGYMRQLERSERAGPGRKPSPRFIVNPLWATWGISASVVNGQ